MKRFNALSTYLVVLAVSSFAKRLIFTINGVYKVQAAGLNPLQLVLLGTVLEIAIFLFEVPTGVVADVYSRRLSMAIGFALIGTGFVIEGSFPSFLPILVAQIFWGVGFTFTSGATEAWIADEVGEGRAADAYLRGTQWAAVGALIGAPVSALIATQVLNLPILLGGGLIILLCPLILLFAPETGFKPILREERGSWRALWDTFSGGLGLVRRQPALRWFFAAALFVGLYSEPVDRLREAHFLENFTLPPLAGFEPVIWFGVLGVVSTLLTIIATWATRRLVNVAKGRVLLVGLAINLAGVAGTLLVWAFSRNFALALAAYWSLTLMRSLAEPLDTAWVNQRVDSQVRATVFSMRSLTDAAGQLSGGPVLGWIGTIFGVRAALAVAAFVLAPAVPIYLRLAGWRGQNERAS